MLKNYLMVFFVSMVPVIELRGAIPIGLGMGLPPCHLSGLRARQYAAGALYLSVCPQVPHLGLPQAGHRAGVQVLHHQGGKGRPQTGGKGRQGPDRCLLLFVGIPLPGTGAWTGTLAASILDMKFKDVLIACMGGVLLAGIIMGLASAGLLGAVSGLFAAG